MSVAIRNAYCQELFEKIFDEIDVASKYLAIFIDEAEISLDNLADTLLALEGGGSEAELKLLMVTSHRIKGSAAAVGLNRAAKMAHLMEDLLQQLVVEAGSLTPELTDAMLKCTDGLKQYVENLKQGSPGEDRFAEFARELALARAETAHPSGEATSGVPRKRAASGAAGKKPAESDSAERPAETLRVDIERLDQLMNLAGQLVINKARFSQIGERLRALAGGNQSSPRELQDSINDLADAIHQLHRVCDGIQKSVMDTRMVPIGPLLNRFKRVVRDISRANGKSVRLQISGEKTDLDKHMVDELGDPLIHMVRNAADHGIENPRDREAAGKPRQGVIRLSAFQRGNSIVVQVADDGRGMDVGAIAQRAVIKGLVSAADVENMTARQIAQLAWEPGLSTVEKVTEVSGRGMGMDIVKSKIEELNGAIDLDTSPGRGTTITVKLPLTLAILPSLMVDVDGDVIAMPIESVAEIVSIDRRAVKTLYGKRAAQVRGRVISLVRLGEVFAWNNAPPANDRAASQDDESAKNGAKNSALTLVVVADRGREIALEVDRVIGEEDIVIKSMADNYRNVEGIAGASILGDGRVSLILDVVALVEMAVKNVCPPDKFTN